MPVRWICGIKARGHTLHKKKKKGGGGGKKKKKKKKKKKTLSFLGSGKEGGQQQQQRSHTFLLFLSLLHSRFPSPLPNSTSLTMEKAAELTQERAAERLFREAVFVAQDVPAGTQLGIDCKAWTTGPRFKGIKMIPSGVHFVYHSAVDTMTSATLSASPRSGFFISVSEGQVSSHPCGTQC